MAEKTGYIGRNPADSSVVIARQTFEPSGSTTTFTFAAGYTVGYLDLYLNGSRLIEGRDYNANNGTTAVLVSAVTSGDVVEIIAYKAFNVGDAASSSTGNFAVGNDLSVNNDAAVSQNLNVTGVTTTGLGLNVSAGGANISGVVTATSYQGDGSALTGIAATDTIAAASLTVSGITTLSNELKVTAGGIEVDGGGVDIAGVSTFAGVVSAGSDVRITGNINAGISTFGAVTVTSITGDGSGLTGVANTEFVVSVATTTSRLVVGNGVTVAGIATASSFDGAISEWTLVSGDGSNYAIKGPGLTGSENDPTLYLKRGQRYNFKNSTGGHPFRIQSTPNGSNPASSGTAYNDGVTNNDAGDGTTLIFDVQHDAPSRLYYQCTSHSSMGGTLVIDTGYSSYDANGFEVTHAGTANTSRFLAGGSVGVGIGVTNTTGRDASAGIGTVKGQIVYNETTGQVEVYTGTRWRAVEGKTTVTGGTETTSGVYTIHTFTSSGSLVVSGKSFTADYLVVAGGGGGGGTRAGGGGAGGMIESPGQTIPVGTHTVTIGGGGTGGPGVNSGAVGENSSLGSLATANGGAYGGGQGNPGGPGGSGGGGSDGAAGGEGTPGQGNDGGPSQSDRGGGGGGGKGGAGSQGPTGTGEGDGAGGPGGAAGSSTYSGSTVNYSGGGGGGSRDNGTPGPGGGGGAGAGGKNPTTVAGNASANQGGGGGGGGRHPTGATLNGGNGGSGIVIVRYQTDSL